MGKENVCDYACYTVKGTSFKMKALLEHKKTIIVFTLIMTVIILNLLLNPWRKPVEQIGANILEQTPIGTSMEQVIEHIKYKGWRVITISYEHGYKTYSSDDWSTSPWTEGAWASNATVGEKSIRVVAGEYRTALLFPIRKVNVEVLWGFDENSELIAIAIQYSTNR